MNGPLTIDAGEAIEVAKNKILEWLVPERLYDRVFYEWMLFQKKPGVAFQFVLGDTRQVTSNGHNITFRDPRILVSSEFSQGDGLSGYAVEDALKKFIPTIGIYESDAQTISRLIMLKWAELPGNPSDVAVQFEYDADGTRIVLTEGATHPRTVSIPIHEPEVGK